VASDAEVGAVARRARVLFDGGRGAVLELAPGHRMRTRPHGLVTLVAGVAGSARHERVARGALLGIGAGFAGVILAERDGVVVGHFLAGKV